jgi:DNA-binding Lrp family transcriptional regulator
MGWSGCYADRSEKFIHLSRLCDAFGRLRVVVHELFIYDALMDEFPDFVPLDRVDLQLLDALQADAALSYDALAQRTGTSPATCQRRVKRLMERGVITARVALVDASRFGPSLSGVVEVTLDRQGAEHLQAFEARAVAEPAVRQCYRVSPGPDFVLVCQVGDMPAWHALVQRLFTQDANVRNVKTFFSVHRAKFDTRVELPGTPLKPSSARSGP